MIDEPRSPRADAVAGRVLRSAAFAAACLIAALSCRGAAPTPGYPDTAWLRATPTEVGLSDTHLQQARDYALTGGGSGLIIRHGKLVMEWGDTAQHYDLKSTTKSIGVTLLGVALEDGKVQLDAPAMRYHPTFGVPPESNAETGWLSRITLRQLANQVAGFEKPGGYGRLLFEPGTKWHYSDAGPNWIAECLTLVYGRDLNELMFERVFTPLGIKPDDIRWRENAYRPHELNRVKRREFGAGFHANVHAMARIGYLYLRNGRWNGRQIIPPDFVRLASRPAKEIAGLEENESSHGNASEHYGMLWWNNGDGTIPALPRDAYWSSGLGNSHILVIPSLDIVAVRAGKIWRRKSPEYYDVVKPFFEPIALAAAAGAPASVAAVVAPPYPPSPVIRQIVWAPREDIIRLAPGGDTWPMTWADDGHLYTAYGDANGFVPLIETKVSMGLGRVEGFPPEIRGVNIRSDIEAPGAGPRGRKASGMLMVDGILYMFLRNDDRQGRCSRLAWSRDHGKTWSEADWRFENFGYPTFVNFGRNYAGARDDFVYIVSHDQASAYHPADRFILMRMPKNRMTDRNACEFFVRRDEQQRPVWTRQIDERGAVFENAGRCYRSGISYNPGIGRYMWSQIIPSGDTKFTKGKGDVRFEGGFGVYDAPEPWGPWTTVFHTEKWDVGPGETSSFPPKWMSVDGRTAHLVFSGDDHFSVRKVEFVLAAARSALPSK